MTAVQPAQSSKAALRRSAVHGLARARRVTANEVPDEFPERFRVEFADDDGVVDDAENVCGALG